MKIIEKYAGTKTYMFPNGAIATPDIVLAKFPAISIFTHIIETDESREVIFAVQNLSAMRNHYKVDGTLSETEAIAAIQDIINAPPSEPEPSAEERIAAALEFQNIMSLEDVEVQHDVRTNKEKL